MPSQRFFELEQLCCRGQTKILASESHFDRFSTHTAGQGASHRCDSSKQQLSFLNRLGHGSMVSHVQKCTDTEPAFVRIL